MNRRSVCASSSATVAAGWHRRAQGYYLHDKPPFSLGTEWRLIYRLTELVIEDQLAIASQLAHRDLAQRDLAQRFPCGSTRVQPCAASREKSVATHQGPAMSKPVDEAVPAPARSSRRAELFVFLIVTALVWPVVAVGVVGGYGFLVWIYQMIVGPPGPPPH